MNSQKEKYSELIDCLCTSLRRSARNISQIYSEHLQQSGEKINANQVSILVLLSQIEKETISELSNKLKMERTTLTRNLKVLDKSGWIKNYSGTDGRMKFTKLSKRGNQVLGKILPYWKQAQNKTKKILGDDLKLFQDNLKKISNL
ncbi:MarR family transcriptional regulator [Methylophilaceae bacterium]|jgi:DNA-binding MarR family transcriptional regulator|nr:MarR family transcriptional regulator [Methylophilaceae bacterium]|tara:strand:+ start:930 stop:1367 length:438 start_codon:yes stop_codon:yes gene_type:complete